MTTHFVKSNRSRYRDHLLCEAHGLDALRAALHASDIDVPAVIRVDELTLMLPFIRTSRCTPEQWTRLGEGLAAMHEQPQPCFGFAEDNYIGLNPQPNGFNPSWGDFFLRQRLEYQLGRITDRRLQRQYSDRLRQHAVRLREFLDSGASGPSLVHGDLWNGNVLCGEDDRVWLIDPAVYYGDAEVDLAMTEMFGGFPADFYSAYRARRPEPPNYELKKAVYNLYHNLNHLNLFGNSYRDGCEAGFAVLEKI